ncbi:MAG: DnaJ domain-containing protein [Chromatiales bacterium]|nr:DnaJ domain-containing protein [Chromatiales bacterium]
MSRAKHLDAIEQACHELLRQHPDGLSEYSLLKRLRTEEYLLFPKLPLGDTLGLFQSHFLLFHSLYRLRDRLHAEGLGHLSISALIIELNEYYEGIASLIEADPLRDYYLDLSNLDETGESDVREMLSDFWRKLQLGEPERVSAALTVLELERAESFMEVKAQYRRLVMRHHPDRGGEAAKMHALNEALEVLRQHFNA